MLLNNKLASNCYLCTHELNLLFGHCDYNGATKTMYGNFEVFLKIIAYYQRYSYVTAELIDAIPISRINIMNSDIIRNIIHHELVRFHP